MPTLETTPTSAVQWEPGEETIVPNCHNVVFRALSWEREDDTIVPGHHQVTMQAFTWDE